MYLISVVSHSTCDHFNMDKTVLKHTKKPYSDVQSRCGHEIRNTKLTGKTILLSNSDSILNPEFLALQRRYLQSNKQFIDNDFEPRGKGLFKRPLEINNAANLKFSESEQEFLKSIKDKVSAPFKRFLAFYDYPELFKIIPFGQNFEAKYFGGFLVKLYFKDRWYDVIVDDRLPVNEEGELIYQKPFNKVKFWPCIVEKAIAKILGGYHRACYIREFEFIHMVHGGFIQKISLENEIIPYELNSILKNVVINDNILVVDGILVDVRNDIKSINFKDVYEFLIFHKSLKDVILGSGDVEISSLRVFENLVDKEFSFQLDGDSVKDSYQVWANQGVEIIKKINIKSMERDPGSGYYLLKPGRYLCLNARNIVYVRRKRGGGNFEETETDRINERFESPVFSNFFIKSRMQVESSGKILHFKGKWVQERGQAGGCSLEKNSENLKGITVGLAHNPQFLFELAEPKDYRLRIHLFKLQKYNNYGSGVAVYRFGLGKVPIGNVVCQDYVHANEPFMMSKINQDVNQIVIQKETVGDGAFLIIPFSNESEGGNFMIRVEYCGYQTKVEEKFEQKMVLTKGKHTLF